MKGQAKPKPASKAKASGKKSKRCKGCGEVKWMKSNQVYCNATCSKKIENSKRPAVPKPEKRMAQLQSTLFFQYLGREASRAGTVEIVPKDSLKELLELTKQCRLVNGYGAHKLYELAHISPVAGHGFVGTLSPANLVISTQLHNRRHGNNYFGGGVNIPLNRLNRKWEVIPGMGSAEIIALIMEYIGEEWCHRFRIDNNLTTDKENKRDRLEAEIRIHPDYEGHDLSNHTPSGLQRYLDKLNGKKAWNCSIQPLDTGNVLHMELTRHAAFRPELVQVIEWYDAYREHQNRSADSFHDPKQIDIPAALNAVVTQHLFDVLAGKEWNPSSLAPALVDLCNWIPSHRHLLKNVFTDFCLEHLGPAPEQDWLVWKRDGTKVWEKVHAG
ncbi:hypothetical protein D9M72_352690 [compost metagenome]